MRDIAHAFLRTEVAPRAQELDQSPDALADVMRKFAAAGLMSLRRPKEFGGPEISEADFRDFQQEAARASGVFAFLQTQHQSGVAMIARGASPEVAARVLRGTDTGLTTIGIGFSQLRRPGPPIMRATPADGGVILDGHVPWVTGFGYYQQFLIGAQLPDGQSVFALMPLASGHHGGGMVTVSPTMKLAAMQSANTVTVDLTNVFVPSEDVLFTKPAGWIAQNDMINVALQGHFAIGCAQSALDVLEDTFQRRNQPFLCDALAQLTREWEQARADLEYHSTAETTTDARLQARAHAIEVMLRAAQIAVVANSGASNYLTHPAQRIYREALVFAVSAQTTAIMEATIQRLLPANQNVS